ncbi:hypothetical protein [Thalassotalea sp. Y01]|uniref:hypothetical protein n=1 Tax=Thalassotalea sp. Y01 TaxID=2729613 RepID=UPI00145F5F8F|nr:hypothetical protein [Thalassotalea sp. Y01]NMP16326.1 hypothetical protein [Thalassotalea sp. Y01]
MQRLLSILLCFLSFSALTIESDTLTVDRAVNADIELAFANDRGIEPTLSDFELLNYVIMSNEAGERYAVVTLKNLASGSRQLESKHLLALFANGERKQPSDFKLNFDANETQSLTISFGENKFPILAISSNSKH